MYLFNSSFSFEGDGKKRRSSEEAMLCSRARASPAAAWLSPSCLLIAEKSIASLMPYPFRYLALFFWQLQCWVSPLRCGVFFKYAKSSYLLWNVFLCYISFYLVVILLCYSSAVIYRGTNFNVSSPVNFASFSQFSPSCLLGVVALLYHGAFGSCVLLLNLA